MADKMRTNCSIITAFLPAFQPWCLSLPGQRQAAPLWLVKTAGATLGASPVVRTAGFYASRSALASPCRTWVRSRGCVPPFLCEPLRSRTSVSHLVHLSGSWCKQQRPRVRLKARNRGAKSFVITAVCIYHHLPLFYHFSV